MQTARVVFTRYRGLILFILSIVIVFWLFYALRSAVLPFIFGLVLAYVLHPFITWVEARLPRQGRWSQTKRVSLIILTFLVILGMVAALSYYVVTAVIEAFLVLVNNAPGYITWALLRLQELAEGLRQQFPPEIQQQVDQFLLDAGTALGNTVKDVFTRGVSAIPGTLHLVFGFAALPIFLFYIMKDWEKLGLSFYSSFSAGVAERVKSVVAIIEGVLGRYIRAQLLLGFIVGYLCFIGLLVLKVPFAPALAAFAGVTELIPVLGPWLGGGAAVIVTLAVAPDKAIWVAVLYVVVQLLENNLLVPRIHGAYLRIHPAVVILLLVLGAYIAGFWGLILAVPLAATIMEIYKYLRRSWQEEEMEPVSSPEPESE